LPETHRFQTPAAVRFGANRLSASACAFRYQRTPAEKYAALNPKQMKRQINQSVTEIFAEKSINSR